MAGRWIFCFLCIVNCSSNFLHETKLDDLSAAENRAEMMMTFIQVREGYLQDIAESVQNMRTNALIASNFDCPFSQRQTLNLASLAHLNKIQKIIRTAKLNGVPLFDETDDGYQSRVSFQLQSDAASLSLQLSGLNPEKPFGFTSEDKFVAKFLPNNETMESASATLYLLDSALREISFERARLGAWYNRLEHAAQIMMGKLSNTDIRQSLNYVEVRLANLAKNATGELYSVADRTELNIEFSLLIDELKRTQSLYGIRSESLSILNSGDNILTLSTAERVQHKLSLLSL